jgi:LacI family transcriptional regulator
MSEPAKPRIRTISELAAATGLGRATVSVALRGGAGVSATTREAVRKVAKEGGYNLRPLVSERMARLRTGAKSEEGEVRLAFLTDYPVALQRQNIYVDVNWQAAKAEADRLGCVLEQWRVPAERADWEAVGRRMVERGVRGVVISAFVPPFQMVALPWNQISSVRLGSHNLCPPMHQVLASGLYAVQLGLQELAALGYRRPGVVLAMQSESPAIERRPTAYFQAALSSMPEMAQIPPLFDTFPDQMPQGARLVSWLKKEKPDVVISIHNDRVLQALKDAGVSVPGDIGYFQFGVLDRIRSHRGLAGIGAPAPSMGCMAVDFLLSLVQSNETGLPSRPLAIEAFTEFCPGRTLRAIHPLPLQ